MLYFTFFCTVTLFIYVLFVLKEERGKLMKRRLAMVALDAAGEDAAETGAEADQADGGKRFGRLSRAGGTLWRMFRRSFGKRMSGERQAKLELKLQQAGRPFGMGPLDFRLLQLVLFAGLPAVCGFYAIILGQGGSGALGFAAAGFAFALIVPRWYLSLKIKQRSRQALKELPDVLDLLTVSLEAGLGFDSALSKLVAKKGGALCDEFQRCLEEIRLGKTRREALLGVRERLVLEELKILISSILQAEKLGIGMVQVMRVQSQEVREQRKQRAEEAAMKAPIKMLFPLVLFIFPSLFIVLLGPALIQFIQTFSK
jgi:tight adherence protein C